MGDGISMADIKAFQEWLESTAPDDSYTHGTLAFCDAALGGYRWRNNVAQVRRHERDMRAFGKPVPPPNTRHYALRYMLRALRVRLLEWRREQLIERDGEDLI